MSDLPRIPDDVAAYYATGIDAERLTHGVGALEFERTKEILLRYLDRPAAIADVGGGVGLYAEWLAGRGHRVELVEPVELNVTLARERAGRPPKFDVHLADACRLPFADHSFDAVLLLGPLYHLGDHEDRVAAVREARRVCRPGGHLFAAAISRFAPLFGAIRDGAFLRDQHHFENVRLEVATGRRVPLERRVRSFPDAYFHLPEELEAELRSGGFEVEAIYGVEGPGVFADNLDGLWQDAAARERLLQLARDAADEPRLAALSDHLLGVGRRRCT